MIERGTLPQTAVEGLERALGRAERDAWITIAATHAGGPAGLQRLLEREGWRLLVWAKRGQVPRHASPLLVAAFNALEACDWSLPCERQLRRIVSIGRSAE